MKRGIRLVLLALLLMTGVAAAIIFAGQKELGVGFSAASLPGSREKEVTLEVRDRNGLPVGDAEVSYEQLSQDFMYNVGEYWDEGGREAGSNTAGLYLDWEWGELEPEDNVYDWGRLKDTMLVDGEGRLATDAEHVFVRLGVIATSAWIVGEKMDSFTETGYPAWINRSDLGQVEEKYLEFVPVLMKHLKFRPDFYMIEVEVNVLGINAGMTNQEVVEWLDRLTDKIKETDPGAKVSIVVGSGDLSPFMDGYRADNRILVEQDRYPLRVTDFLNRMKGVDYDMITVLIQPFGWMSKGDCKDAERFLDSLCAFNRSVYVAWAAFLAEEPRSRLGSTRTRTD